MKHMHNSHYHHKINFSNSNRTFDHIFKVINMLQFWELPQEISERIKQSIDMSSQVIKACPEPSSAFVRFLISNVHQLPALYFVIHYA